MKFLKATCPLFSRELIRRERLAILLLGIAILFSGSILTPSDDWDVGVCVVMGVFSYLFSPWAFRQVWNFRWRMMPLAALTLWVVVDGVYVAYWALRDFDALSVFRTMNFIYSAPLFWLSGFVFNIDFCENGDTWKCGGRNRILRLVVKLHGVVVVVVILSLLVGLGVWLGACHCNGGWKMPMDSVAGDKLVY